MFSEAFNVKVLDLFTLSYTNISLFVPKCFLQDMSICWFNVFVVLFLCFYYFKSKSLVKSYCSFIANLNMPEIRQRQIINIPICQRTMKKVLHNLKCLPVDQRWYQNDERTTKWQWDEAEYVIDVLPTFLFHLCFFLYRHIVTWNLFVLYNKEVNCD